MILRRARPRSSVERDHDPPSSSCACRCHPCHGCRRRCYILLRLSGIQAFFAPVASRTARAITSRCRTWSSSRFFFLHFLFPRSLSIWLPLARHTSTSPHEGPLKDLPANPAFITFLFLWLFLTVMIAETTGTNCFGATWIPAVS